MTAGVFCSPQLTHTPPAWRCAACCLSVYLVLCQSDHGPYSLKHLLEQVLNMVLVMSSLHSLMRNFGGSWSLSLGSLPPPERDQADCLCFTDSSFVPEQIGMDKVSWRQVGEFSVQYGLDCFRTMLITSKSAYFRFEESPLHLTFQGLLFLSLY